MFPALSSLVQWFEWPFVFLFEKKEALDGTAHLYTLSPNLLSSEYKFSEWL